MSDMKRNRVRGVLRSRRPGPGEDTYYKQKTVSVSVIEWKPWCLVLTSSGLKFQLMGGGTWLGSYQQVTLTVTLGQCLMFAHSTHAHIGGGLSLYTVL